ncbi:hypothetical protein F4781DRAFT_393810 [Annulohypoxylon bovei var. microspora]|nr:hypothetical protein F4781DRAFT_393810 [Annulohypoxylon bovei var. microspora]
MVFDLLEQEQREKKPEGFRRYFSKQTYKQWMNRVKSRLRRHGNSNIEPSDSSTDQAIPPSGGNFTSHSPLVQSSGTQPNSADNADSSDDDVNWHAHGDGSSESDTIIGSTSSAEQLPIPNYFEALFPDAPTSDAAQAPRVRIFLETNDECIIIDCPKDRFADLLSSMTYDPQTQRVRLSVDDGDERVSIDCPKECIERLVEIIAVAVGMQYVAGADNALESSTEVDPSESN